MSLRDALAADEFVVTAELGPPVNPDPERVRTTARAFSGAVRAANVTDNQAATVKLSPLACSVWMLEAGVHFFQSNIVYDVERFAVWLEPVVAAGVTERAPLLVGVTPPRSTRMLRHMHDNIPGVEVDRATFARMEGLEGDEAKAAGVEIAVELVKRLREVPGLG